MCHQNTGHPASECHQHCSPHQRQLTMEKNILFHIGNFIHLMSNFKCPMSNVKRKVYIASRGGQWFGLAWENSCTALQATPANLFQPSPPFPSIFQVEVQDHLPGPSPGPLPGPGQMLTWENSYPPHNEQLPQTFFKPSGLSSFPIYFFRFRFRCSFPFLFHTSS